MKNGKYDEKIEEGIIVSQYSYHLGISFKSMDGIPSLSVCYLTKTVPDIYEDLYPFPENAVVYEFNKIKAGYKREGKGDGTAMMKELVRLADEQGFYIISGINPYGALDFKALQKWYAKYGFEMLEERGNCMVRVPKG